jgi:putative ATPase
LRAAIAEARERTNAEQSACLDEIHRFNKSQQDALLPAVEDGTVTLIGATTENHRLKSTARCSRAAVVVLHP